MSVNFGGFLIRQFGAYIQTDLSALQNISGVASGVIAMVGLAEKGPTNTPVTVNSYSELVSNFGNGPLVVSGLAAFVGGAGTIVAVRLNGAEGASLTAADAVSNSSAAYEFRAREKGTLGNNIHISVEHQMAGSAPGNGDTSAIRIKYTDEMGNDVRETFVVPAFIPDMTGEYYTGNPGNYYVLYNTESGTVREIPHTWGYGNANEDAFLTKVEELKGNEELLGPFPADTGSNAFPLAVIAAVINNGGFGNSPSRLVTLIGADPDMEDLLTPGYVYNPGNAEELLTHPFVPLSGGKNGDDGTNYYGDYDSVTGLTDYDMTYFGDPSTMDVWDEALSVLESEDVNFVQLAYLFNEKGDAMQVWDNRYGYFKNLMPKLLAHINTMSNIPNRMFRTSIVGVPYFRAGDKEGATEQEFLEEIQEISGLINSDRIQLWTGGFQSRAFSTRVQKIGGETLANFVVGAQASRTPSTSLTFAAISGIITDGLEFAFNSAQRDELYTRRHAFVLKRKTAAGNTEFVAANNYTSHLGAPNRGSELMITRRIIDYTASTVYKNIEETFIGRKMYGEETASQVTSYAEAILERMVREDIITAYEDVTANVDEFDPTVIHVEYSIQPVSEINFVLITQRLTYTLT